MFHWGVRQKCEETQTFTQLFLHKMCSSDLFKTIMFSLTSNDMITIVHNKLRWMWIYIFSFHFYLIMVQEHLKLVHWRNAHFHTSMLVKLPRCTSITLFGCYQLVIFCLSLQSRILPNISLLLLPSPGLMLRRLLFRHPL